MDAGDDSAPVASTSRAGTGSASELASMKASTSSSPKKRKRQGTAASSDHPEGITRTRAVDVENDDDDRPEAATGTPGKRKRTRNKKTLQAVGAEDQMNDAASASSRSGASLSHSRSGSSTPVVVEAQGNGKGKGKGASKISRAASSVDAGHSTTASTSREPGQTAGDRSQANGHGADLSRSGLKEFKQAKLQEFVTTVEDAYRQRNPGITPEAWDQDHELRMKMARDMLSQAFTSGPPAPTDPPPPLPLYRKAMDAQMREALGVPAKGRHKKKRKAEKGEPDPEQGESAAGRAAASASASTSASASGSGESGSSDEDDDDDDDSSGAFDFSGLKTEMGNPRYEPREAGQATLQELALPDESFKERMYRMANGAVVKDRSERARLRRAAKEQLLERAENPRPDTAEEADAKTATQARKAEKRRKQKELRRARLEKEASKPGTTAEDAEKLREKAERLRVAEEKAMLKAQKKQENLERHQQQVEAARQRKAEKAQQAKNALVIDESSREEGELGLGDLFVVDTTPADLPEELKRTREAQEQAEREAAQNDVPLNAAATDQSVGAATVPSYAGTSGTSKEAQPRYLGISRRELEPDEDDSESEDDNGMDDAPKDLAIHVHADTAAEASGPSQPATDDGLGLGLDDLEEEEDFRQENRYFKEEDPTKICRRCGETGHLMRDCEHIQCMTCGKLDDHEQRNCPVTMTCHRCGSRGHFVSDCSLAPGESRNNRTCERCSSRMHQSTNCPYIWRVYIRSANAPRNPSKYNFSCYNCASGEHFGDDCPKPRGHPLKFVDRSAFTINTERPHNRSTLDPGPPLGMRAGQLAGDGGMSGATTEEETPLAPYKGSGGRPNIINGKRAPASLPPRPPSDAPRGPKALSGGDGSGNKTKTQLRNEGRDFQKEVQDAISSRASTHTSQREKAGLVDFGNLDDLEEGEEEEEDDFAKRLKGKDGRPRPSPKLPGGQRPGAKDRRKARSQEESEAGSVDGRSGVSSKAATQAATGKTFQPFKNFNEAGGSKASSGVRSRSRSPQRHDRSRQPSPPAPDWRKSRDREADDRSYSGAHSRSELLSQRLDENRGNGRGRGRGGHSHAPDRDRDRDYSRGGPSASARSSGGGGSLLDRIENGRASISRDDYRNFPRGRQDTIAGGDSYVPLSGGGGDNRRSEDSRGGGGGGRGGRGGDSGGYRGGKHRGGKYRGGYM